MPRLTHWLGCAIAALLLAACGGRSNLNPGGLGNGGGVGGAGPAQGVGGQVTSSVGASSPTGSGGAGSGVTNGSGGADPSSGVGPGGSGVGPGSSAAGPGTTGPGGGPLDCFQCIGQECPEALQCLQDPTCMQGIVCTVSQCLSGGQPDFSCLLGCFNGDFQAAMQAFQSLSCVMSKCQDDCGGLLGG